MNADSTQPLIQPRQVMQSALESERGVRLSFLDRGYAVAFRHGCYRSRSEDRQTTRQIYSIGHPMRGRSEFDQLVFHLTPPDEEEETKFWVLEIKKQTDWLPSGAVKVEEIEE